MQNRVEICGIDTRNLEVLPEKEKIKLIKPAQNGDQIAREKLIYGNLKLVLSVIQKFVNRNEPLDDLFQIGCIGLIKSIDNFDVTQNVRFSTYAVPMIIGEIKRYLRDNSQIRVSRSVKDTAFKAMQVREKFIVEKNREPSASEIAAELGIGKEEVVIALESAMPTISLQEPVYSENADSAFLIDQISCGNDDSGWAEEITLREAIKNLDPREKKILSLRFISGFTQSEVAKKMKISQAQISRLEKYALQKVKTGAICNN